MTDSEFRYLIETYRVSLRYELDWVASVDYPAAYQARADAPALAVERLAKKAGWLTAKATAADSPLFHQLNEEDV